MALGFILSGIVISGPCGAQQSGVPHTGTAQTQRDQMGPERVAPAEGLPGGPSTGFTPEKPMISPKVGPTPSIDQGTADMGACAGSDTDVGPTTGPTSSSLPSDFGASLTQPGIGATPPHSSEMGPAAGSGRETTGARRIPGPSGGISGASGGIGSPRPGAGGGAGGR